MRKPDRLLVLVSDHEVKSRGDVTVEVRSSSHDPWRALPYVEPLQRYVLAGVGRGSLDLRVRGHEDLVGDERTVTVHEGENFVHVTIGPKDLGYYLAADDERVYFRRDDSKVLFYARGRGIAKLLPHWLSHVEVGKQIESIADAPNEDEIALQLQLPTAPEPRRKVSDELVELVDEKLPAVGITARLALPMHRGKGPDGNDVIEGLTSELVVRFRPEVTDTEIRRIAARFGLTIVRHVTYLGNAYVLRLRGMPTYDILRIARDLRTQFPVAYAEPNVVFKITNDQYTPNDFLYPEQPHVPLISGDDAWDRLDNVAVALRSGSPNITVAVFDPHGVSPDHPNLTGLLTDGTAKQVSNFDFQTWSAQTTGGLGGDHGTQCASSAVGGFDDGAGSTGIAGNCHLIGARLPAAATGLDMADAWIWAAGFQTGSTNPSFPAPPARGADVLSNSWGINNGALTSTVRDALDFLTVYGRGGRGCVVCFSTGNLGYMQFSTVRRMAAYERTIAVGASINANPTNPCQSVQPDPAGNTLNLPAIVDTRAYYSPFGPELDVVAPSHTSYDATGRLVDPIVSATRVNAGTWIANATATTNLAAPAAPGATTIQVNSTAGLVIGEFLLLGVPGAPTNAREFTPIRAIAGNTVTVASLVNAYPGGTPVASGPNDYDRTFGGTSHATPTVAGAAALILSVRPELTWVQVREIVRTTAARVDATQANPTGQWSDNDGDGVAEFSQWYGYGRIDVDQAIQRAQTITLPDVVIRDNLADDGGVPSGGWHASSPDVWVRRNDDPVPTLAYTDPPPHENPRRGQDNFVFLRVRNVSTVPTNEVYLRALITHFPGFEFRYPQEWQPSTRPGATVPSPLVPGTYLIGEARIDNVPPGAERIVKLRWNQALVPPATVTIAGMTVNWHPCLLAEVSPHDGPAPSGATFDVKRDNNLAHRNISIDDAGTDSDYAVAVVAGTSDASGVEAIVIDRSSVGDDQRVFVRIDDDVVMREWRRLVKEGRIVATDSLDPGEHDIREADGSCRIVLLDDTRLSVCSGSGTVIHARAGTEIEIACAIGARTPHGRPKVGIASVQGRDVIVFEGGAPAIALPVRLAARQYVPVVLGVSRPPGARRGRGVLRATQRRGDGSLSAGYVVQG